MIQTISENRHAEIAVDEPALDNTAPLTCMHFGVMHFPNFNSCTAVV